MGSYDVPVPDDASVLALEDARKVFQSTFPQAHRQFLRGLKLSFRLDDYLFVHAGLKPGVPLEKQDPEHLIWIREPFLTYRKRFDQIVVHGHSVRTEVEFFPTSDAPVRIGVDTGAWKTGRLTALVLEGESRRLLQTGG